LKLFLQKMKKKQGKVGVYQALLKTQHVLAILGMEWHLECSQVQ